jgi:hypothetical protein
MAALPVWFLWPITLTGTATFTAVSLWLNARRNGAPRAKQVPLAIAGALVPLAPAIAMTLGTSVSCNEDLGPMSITREGGFPPAMFLGFAAVTLIALTSLQEASGRLRRPWRFPCALLGIALVGVLVETFVGYLALAATCTDGGIELLVVHYGVALVLPPIIVMLRVRGFRRWS